MSTTKGGGVVRFVMKNTIRREGWDDLVCQQCFVWKKKGLQQVHIKVKVYKEPSRTQQKLNVTYNTWKE